MKNQTIDTIAPRFAELMIRKIEALTEDWRQPWITDMTQGLPRNLRGTPYRAGNLLLLMILTEMEKYSAPVFLTFRQAKEEGLNIRNFIPGSRWLFFKLYTGTQSADILLTRHIGPFVRRPR